MKKSIDTYYCRCCGGTNIQVMAWVDANTNKYCSDVNTPCEEEDTWCDDCEEHTGILTLKQLWEYFAEIPVNNEDEIEEPFLNFDVGTPKQEVWHWFDERCPNNLHDDLMFPYSFIKVGNQVHWNDPAINDYDKSEQESVRNTIYTIDAIKYVNGTLDDDTIICISSESGTEAEVFPHELRPVIQRDNIKKLTLEDIQNIYLESEVVMGETLASIPADGLSIEEAFELYIEAMEWCEGDKFYRISEGELEKLPIKPYNYD